MRKRSLDQATVVITGASSGIGRATAHLLARRHANLVLAARNLPALEDVVAECESAGGRAIAVATDVTDAAGVQSLAEAAAAEFGGRIDVWINNAGIGAVGPFTEVPLESHEQVIRTNLVGYFYGAYAALPYFQRQRSGVLVNVNSEGGWVPTPYAVAYSASKFGLRGFSEALRGELSDSPDIHVCDVFPAFIDTPGLRHAGNYVGREIRPVPPLYDPYDVAAAIVSLAERPRSAVTVGQSATVARIAHFLAPGLVGRGLKRLTDRYLRRARPVAKGDGNLFAPPPGPQTVHGDWRRERSRSRPARAAAALAAGVAVGLLLTRR